MRSRALAAALALALTGACATLVAAGGLPDLDGAIEDAPGKLGDGAYPFAGAMAFLELGTLLGVPLPFEVGVILSGAVAGDGEIAWLPLVAIVWASASIGECVNYWCGHRFGRPFLERHGRRFRVTPALLARVDGWFDRHGPATVLVSRFVPLVRSSAPFVAGSSQMPFRVFLPWMVAGNVAWAAAFTGLGYAFYRSAAEVADVVGDVGLASLGLVIAAAALVLLRGPGRRRREASPPERRSG